jgi:hypothetical protein
MEKNREVLTECDLKVSLKGFYKNCMKEKVVLSTQLQSILNFFIQSFTIFLLCRKTHQRGWQLYKQFVIKHSCMLSFCSLLPLAAFKVRTVKVNSFFTFYCQSVTLIKIFSSAIIFMPTRFIYLTINKMISIVDC